MTQPLFPAPTASASAIRVRQLTHQVTDPEGQPQTILHQLDFDIPAGVSTAITGRSGSGKSTLLGLLAGLDRATTGEIWLHNTPLHTLNEENRAALRLREIGFVFQNFELLQHLSALENVMLPLQLAGLPRQQVKARAGALLEQVGLTHRVQQRAQVLSGGEQQRVAIARALANRPRIIFADEPTGNLDGQTASAIEQMLFNLNEQEQTTLVVVTHDLKLAARCQQQLQLVDGRL